MTKPRIYADFIKKDQKGRLLLVSLGSLEDIKAHALTIADRHEVVFYSDDADATGRPDDLEVDGIVEWDQERGHWVGMFDPNAFRHHSELPGS